MSLNDGMVTEDTVGGKIAPPPASTPAAPAPKAESPKADAKPASPAKAPAAPAPTTIKPGAKVDAKPAATSSDSIFDDADDEEPAPAADAAKDGDPAADATDKPDGEEQPKASAGWPDDWREKIANGDEKHLAELKRFASFENYARSQRALRQKISSGELKKVADFDPEWDDARKTAWRQENGIPDKPEGYMPPAVEGYEWSEKDKVAMTPLLERLHGLNAKPEIVQAMQSYYAEAVQAGREMRAAADREHKVETEDTIRSEWGNDYRPNLKLTQRALNDPEIFPGGMEEGGIGRALMTARTDDGRRLINSPQVLNWLAQVAREHYGEGALIPSQEASALNSREEELLKVMRTDIDRYHRERNSRGQTMQQELAEIRARKSGKRAA